MGVNVPVSLLLLLFTEALHEILILTTSCSNLDTTAIIITIRNRPKSRALLYLREFLPEFSLNIFTIELVGITNPQNAFQDLAADLDDHEFTTNSPPVAWSADQLDLSLRSECELSGPSIASYIVPHKLYCY